LSIVLNSNLTASNTGNSISLVGKWNIRLDSLNLGESEKWYNTNLDQTINLPGTTDEAHLGRKTSGSDYGVLTRVYKYLGPAWYQKEIDIPEHWSGNQIFLFLERVIWQSKVFIDGEEISQKDALATPHIHQLGKLNSGKHMLTIRVDNNMMYNIGDKGHAYSEYMQTIWNGIVGKIELQTKPDFHINNIKTFPDPDLSHVSLDISLTNPENKHGQLKISVYANKTSELVGQLEITVLAEKEIAVIPINKIIEKWDEFSPSTYTLKAELSDSNRKDIYKTTFGFRRVSTSKSHVLINDKPVFLRGNLDCIHFPLTGYPAMDADAWKRIFRIYKENGLNHVRFHSWCPPEAAFVAADELGIYIQAEASVWIDWWMGRTREESKERPEMYTKGEPKGLGEDNPDATEFVAAEIDRILETYGNHPSFIMFCTGNELGNSNFQVLGDWMQRFKTKDPRRLYAASTARQVTEHCDYSATHNYPDVGMVRQYLTSHNNWDYEDQYSQTPVPVIAHETGQWPVYPDWDEISKYTGVVRARNLEGFRDQAKVNGIFDQNKDLKLASGKLSILLYKDEIESFMRTPSCAGIQILSMQDYAGQGEALIGWLDSFYDSKGVITSQEVRKFLNYTVPLVKLLSYVFEAGDTLNIPVLLHHFGKKDLNNQILSWKLFSENVILNQGNLPAQNFPRGKLTSASTISMVLPDKQEAMQCTLQLNVDGTSFTNSWKIWIYPKKINILRDNDVFITEKLNDGTLNILENGGKVLLLAYQLGNPDNVKYAAWRPLYWSASFFPGQNVATIGLLIRDSHPVFDYFPTGMHSDWQWWNICEGGRGFILNTLPGSFKPFAQPVSDFHFNHKLGTIFEVNYSRGKLMVCGYNLTSERDHLPEVRQLKYSLIRYMNSSSFKPHLEVGKNFLLNTFQ